MKGFLQNILQEITKKIIIGTSDAWSMRWSFYRPNILYWRLSDFKIDFIANLLPCCSLRRYHKSPDMLVGLSIVLLVYLSKVLTIVEYRDYFNTEFALLWVPWLKTFYDFLCKFSMKPINPILKIRKIPLIMLILLKGRP